MKKTKLKLQRQTLTTLSPARLREVAGGQAAPATGDDCTVAGTRMDNSLPPLVCRPDEENKDGVG